MGIRFFILGAFTGIFLFACAGVATFKYKHYVLTMAIWEGTLQGPKIEDDLPVTVCEKNNCICMITPDFLAMKQDYLDTKNTLSDTQAKLTACLSK